MLQIVICQQIGHPRRNGQISRNIKLAKTESGGNNLNRPITNSEIEFVIKKQSSQQMKVLYQTASKENSSKFKRSY